MGAPEEVPMRTAQHLSSLFFLFALSSAALADTPASPVTPLPGREVIKPAKPDWCEDAEVEDWLMNADHPLAAVGRLVGGRYSEKTLRAVAQVACVRPNDPDFQRSVAAWRQG